MIAVLTFAVVLLLAVLVSGLAQRTVLSTAVLFLVAGFVAGPGVLGLVPVNQPLAERLAEVALVSVLVTDGMKVRYRSLVSGWELPGRALLLGMPLTLGLTAVFARYVAGLGWVESFLVGAVLSPTDPVFASAIVGRRDIPFRLRHLLNVESGLNDGLALPVVVILLAILDKGPVRPWELVGEVAFGVVLGVSLSWLACAVARPLAVSGPYQPLFAVAVALVVYAVAKLLNANEYLAAFATGITLGNTHPKVREAAHGFGEHLAELLKLAALLVFGALISPRFLGAVGARGYAFAVLALVVARPAALALVLWGTALDWRERLTAMWFGPKGFASVVYGLLVLQSGVAGGAEMFRLIAVTVALSILAHSSTDVLVARWLRRPEAAAP